MIGKAEAWSRAVESDWYRGLSVTAKAALATAYGRAGRVEACEPDGDGYRVVRLRPSRVNLATLADTLGVSWATAQRAALEMQRAGCLSAQRTGRSSAWVIVLRIAAEPEAKPARNVERKNRPSRNGWTMESVTASLVEKLGAAPGQAERLASVVMRLGRRVDSATLRNAVEYAMELRAEGKIESDAAYLASVLKQGGACPPSKRSKTKGA